MADSSWEEKFNHLQAEHKELQGKYNQLREETKQDSNPNERTRLSDGFWQDIIDKFKLDPEKIKSLIKTGEISLDRHVNGHGENVLVLAAKYGCYEIVQFCINLGADLDWVNDDGDTAVTTARKSGFYHIEQLLLFSRMNVSIGNEIKHTANSIDKQNGINQIIHRQLVEIGEQTQQLFEKTLMELMVNTIQNRLSFSDDMLNLCWSVAARNNKDPLQSELWATIKATVSQIVDRGSKKDWYWLKHCIWYREIGSGSLSNKDGDSPQYLYYELLKLVSSASQNQLTKLKEDLDVLASQHPDEWTALVKWDIPDQYEHVRQDTIPNGVVSAHTYHHLSQSSDATFNSAKFYDHNQYLSQLVLLAHIVDDEFHESMRSIFSINKTTNIGAIDFNKYRDSDEKKANDANDGDGVIEYSRGPVKLIERARFKAENDYSGEPYPASACVLDLNRCSLVFNDISTMLTAMQLFVNKIKYFQSGNIIAIVRDKNGFIEYAKQVQYADIKLNVLIKGQQNNIIGEVQFLLKKMKEYKNKAHNLYAIQRKEETIQSSVSKILPLLLDEDRQLFIAGNVGDEKSLCKLMVTNNKSVKDLMRIDDESRSTIMHSICKFGHIHALCFIQSLCSTSQFVEYVFYSDREATKPIEYAIRFAHLPVVQHLFAMDEIRQKYQTDDNMLFRLLFWLLAKCRPQEVVNYVLDVLQISVERIEKCLTSNTYPKNDDIAGQYFLFSIIARIAYEDTGSIDALEKVKSIVSIQAFVDGVFMKDGYEENALENAIQEGRVEMMQYLMDIAEVRERCLQHDELYVVIRCLNDNWKQDLVNAVINGLSLTEKKLSTVQQLYPGLNLNNILYQINNM